MNETIGQVIDRALSPLDKWRRITIAGKTYRTHPDNVPAGLKAGCEFVLRWRVGKVWARLED
jgi:hypothetical protein